MKILISIGTRPEAIKMAALIRLLKNDPFFDLTVCNTGQHDELIKPVFDLFEIVPDYSLDIMKPGVEVHSMYSAILDSFSKLLKNITPDIVFVHGDTATTFASAMSAYLNKNRIAHVEAGLRTGNLYSPWPEEGNRRLVGSLANVHYAPTNQARENLIREGIQEENIVVTGNTVIDSLVLASNKLDTDQKLLNDIQKKYDYLEPNKKTILVTGHRRENFGDGFKNICNAISAISNDNKDVQFIYPVHLNPNVIKPVNKILKNQKNIFLIEPVDYIDFIYLMRLSYLILTDSGGIQEEAPSMGKPVLLMRDTSERPEAIDAGTVLKVGADEDNIIKYCQKLINDNSLYDSMSNLNNPFGDGRAAEKIKNHLKNLNL